MELRLYFQMLRRGWRLILVTTLIAVAVSLGISYLVTPKYRAVARFIISPSSTQQTADMILRGLQTLDSQTVMTTYAEVMNSDRVYDAALKYLQLTKEQMLPYTHEAVVLPTSSVLELSVIGPDPVLAAKLANTVGNQAIGFYRSADQVIAIDFLDQAAVPSQQHSPQPLRDAALALAIGLVGGAVLAVLREQLLITVEAFQQSLRLDGDTGVYNRRYFRRLLDEHLGRHPDDTLSVGIVQLTFLGLDDVIESYPVSILHRVVKQATDRMRSVLRGNDQIGRWDDTSFIIMLPNTSGQPAARTFDRIHLALKGSVDVSQFGLTINLDSFIGAASKTDGVSSDELVKEAGSALEQARRDESSPVRIWGYESKAGAQERTQVA
jgi:diguanylate cyclase (GGDEF)-like protein